MRVRERVVEPLERVRVLEAVVRHREVRRAADRQHHPRRRDLDRVEDLARILAGQQQRGDLVDVGGLGLLEERLLQALRLGGRQRRRVGQQARFD